MAELKPCPFCGGEAALIPNNFFSESQKKWTTESYGVRCKHCKAQGYQFWPTEKYAIEAWNRRSDQ